MRVLVLLFSHHDLGDDVKHLLMTAAAAGGAMCHLLYVLECFQNVVEILVLIERVSDISVAYLLTIAHHIIFYHNDNQTFHSSS